MPTCKVEFATALKLEASDADLSSMVQVIHASGGSDVSVLQNQERGHILFSLNAHNRNQGFQAAARILEALTQATPAVVGGWILVSITAT